jgi:Dockerin type I domain
MADDLTAAEHPDGLALELVRTGEGSPENRAHVDACATCRAVLAGRAGLANELRAASPTPIEIPAEIDGRILWSARKRALEIRRGRRWRRVSVRPGWAVAAMALLAFGVAALWWQGPLATPSAPPQRIARADIDGDGRIDMIDALRLARAVRRGGALDPAWDVNGDGTVDHRDTDAVAMRAVAIEGA